MTDFWHGNHYVGRCCQVGMFALGLAILISCQQEVRQPEAEEFFKNIRSTEARSPSEEQAGFRVPRGFRIQLFASEPDIAKPLNMAFDSKGRMWLTQSYEYPFADTTGTPRDKISILEDTDGDGKADVIKTFADKLNIPIGIVAVQDGAIAYSIPSIYHFVDHDGDDQVDERKVLYSGFQYNDTHGMINNLMRSWDGWIHADHGFANTSTVAGSDGDTIVMVSGNTFRFRTDGSRIEFTTTGRVNPYGYAYDELGYTYSSDCHTSPIYQLIRGADYPHFSKKPTGIGFGPALMDHNYGSTALAGLEYYLADQFPESYQESFFLGDVVKSRVYRATMQMQGTTPKITWQEDFIVSEDPWFRPVDVKLGPDGALYVADFYNRIIGHYEVPLDHPGRDRQRGRIWRISYEGMDKEVHRDWSAASLEELMQNLNHPNLPLRMSLADNIVDQFDAEALVTIKSMLNNPQIDFKSYVQGLWILFRLDALDTDLLTHSLQHDHEVIRTQTRRIVFEMSEVEPGLLQTAIEGLNDNIPHVQRESVMIAGRHPNKEQVSQLLKLAHQVPEHDTHLAYCIKQSLRDHIRNPEIMAWVQKQSWSVNENELLAFAMLGDTTQASAAQLTAYIKSQTISQEQLGAYAKHIASYGSSETISDLISTMQQSRQDIDQHFDLYSVAAEGIEQSGRKPPRQMIEWGRKLAQQIFSDIPEVDLRWKVEPFDHQPFNRNPWILYDTAIVKNQSAMYLISGPVDEGYEVSKMISPNFIIPASFKFMLIGAKGPPGANEAPTPPENRIELVEVSGEVIRKEEINKEWFVKNVHWEFEPEEIGRQVRLIITDGSRSRGDFIGIGDLEPPLIDLPAESPGRLADKLIFASEIASDEELPGTSEVLIRLLADERIDVYVRASSARALWKTEPGETLPLLKSIIDSDLCPKPVKEEVIMLLVEDLSEEIQSVVLQSFNDLTYQRQKQVASAMCKSPEGIEALLRAVEDKSVNGQFLSEVRFREELASELSAKHREWLESLVTTGISQDRQALIDARLWGYRMERHSAADGPATFATFCASCHQLNGEGSLIGPQLDGIGNWGLVALTEKILDPNRNISKAFSTYSIELKDGSTKYGLLKSEEAERLVFADAAGEEFVVLKKEIATRSVSPYTLMPAHFGQIIPEKQYYALITYLLNQI